MIAKEYLQKPVKRKTATFFKEYEIKNARNVKNVLNGIIILLRGIIFLIHLKENYLAFAKEKMMETSRKISSFKMF